MKPKFRSLAAAFAPLALTPLIVCAFAAATSAANANQVWTGGTDALWSNSFNWAGFTVPVGTESAVFNASSIANLSIDTGANQTVGGLVVGSPVGAVTISNNTLTLGTGGIDMSAATQNLTLNSAVTTVTNTAQEWAVASGRTLTLATTPTGGTGVVRLNTTAGGTINIPGGTANDLIGRFATLNLGDFAGLDASKNVVAGNTLSGLGLVTYVPNPTGTAANTANLGNGTYDVIDVKVSNAAGYPSAFRLGGTAVNSSRGIRFNTAHTAGADWVIDNSSTRNFAVVPGYNILVGSNVNTNVIWNGSGTIRTFGSGQHDLYITNHSSSNLLFNTGFSVSSGRSWRLIKSGTGKVIFAGQADSVNGGLYVDKGTAQIGNAGTTGTINGTGGYVIASGATLDFNRTDTALSVGNVISGGGVVKQVGTGTVSLTGVNTYTGGTNITAGAIGATSTSNFGTGDITLNGGAVQFGGAFDLTGGTGYVVVGTSGATFNTNGFNVSFSNSFQTGSSGAVTKTGAGSLSLTADNDYTGGTVVSAGTLLADAPSSSTGSGTVTVNSAATLGGTGVISGTASILSGGILAPGAGVGTLTAGGLNLNTGSTAVFEFNTTPDNDKVSVSNSGGLTINGGAISLVQEGTSNAFTTPGTYNLISYSGSIAGTGISALSVANPQAGFSYTFGTSGGFVTLTIATTGVVSEWGNTGGGSWATAGNWTNSTPPNSNGATANFLTAITGPSTVTLDGAKTVGAITFNNANAYAIDPGTGGGLTLNNGTNPSAITVNDGNHSISTAITLATSTGITTAAADDSLVLSGVVSGAAGKTLIKTGLGSLSLLGANDFAGNLTLSAGTTTFANGGLGAGNLSIDASTLIWNAGNTQDISNRTITFGSGAVAFDTNGNNVTLANSIGNSGTASFNKKGAGTLTLASNPTFTGASTVNAGTLQLGNGGSTGLVSGAITNNATVAVKLADGSSFPNLVTGTGSFVHAGSGALSLTAQNTFTGTTTIPTLGASLVLTDALNLQSSTLDYLTSGSPSPTAGGSLNFGALTATTLGGLSGNKNLVLENATPAAVTLTIGNNGLATSYSGALSGSGALTKIGAGVSTLAGANTYTGATNVNGGTLQLGAGGSISGTSLTVNPGGIMTLAASSSNLSLSGLCNLVNTGGGAVLLVQDGTATLSGGIQALSNNNNGYRLEVDAGTVSITNARFGRGSLAFTSEALAVGSTTQGLYVNGGTVNISGVLEMSVNGSANSSVSTFVNSGALNVAGKITVGLNNGGRWSVLQVSGGEFKSTDTVDGLVLGGPAQGNALFAVMGGTSTVERIQLGQGTIAGISLLRVTAGELYVGSGGIVKGSVNNASEIRLVGGTLAAKADWTTTVPINLSGTGNALVKAADVNGDARNITLNGALTGTASLDKEGAGTLTLGGGHSHTGATTVFEGTLTVKTKTFDNGAVVDVRSGATLNLDYTGGDRIGTLVVEGTTYSDPGTYGAVGSGATTELAGLTGSGLIYIGIDPPASAYDTWASAKGLTVGLNDGPNDDPDNDSVENQLEFVLGGNPLASSTSILPTLSVTPTNFVFTFTRNDDSEAEVALAFEHGTDLSGWTPIAIGADTAGSGAGVVVTENAADPDTVTVSISRGTESKIFGRLRAVK